MRSVAYSGFVLVLKCNAPYPADKRTAMETVAPNTPLVEAVCEFRFPANGEWDWTLPGRLYEQIKDEFSVVEQVGGPVTLPNQSEGSQIIIPLMNSPSLVRMVRQDRSAMVQIGPGMLVVNHFAQGYSWAAFLGLIRRIRGLYDGLVAKQSSTRVGLRYINQLPFPDFKAEIGSVLAIAPPIPSEFCASTRALFQRLELVYDDLPGTLILQSGTQEVEGYRFIMVDLDIGTTMDREPIDEQGVWRWLESAHSKVKTVFRATLRAR